MKLKQPLEYRHKKQRGAVMLETAYVLPLVLGVILLVAELVIYALNSFAVNDVLTDVHTEIIREVQEVGNLDPGAALGFTPVFASCSEDNKVVLAEDKGPEIANIITSSLSKKNVTFLSSRPATVTIEREEVSEFSVYVITFSGVANALVLPEFLNVLLPISVTTIVSIKSSCTPSS